MDVSKSKNENASVALRTESPHYRISSSLASSIITNHDLNPPTNEPNSLQMLQKRTEEVLDSASQSFLSGNLIDELAYRTGNNFNGNNANDDPTLKHRCRYCGKIFGSDSALQIHLRSHTGERPFKCNMCPSSFTTKGNLKVHYQRHTQQESQFDMMMMHANRSTQFPFLTKSESPYNVQSHDGQLHSLDNAKTNPIKMISTSPADKMHSKLETSATDLTKPKNIDSERNIQKQMPLISESPARPSSSEKISLKNFELLRDQRPNSNTSADSMLLYNLRKTSTSHKKAWENFIEITKTPETSKLQNMVDKLDPNLRDPNKCPLCHRILSCRSALRQHYRTHTGERPFRCRLCGRSFTTKGNLKTHIGIHKLQPLMSSMHKCPICHKKYSNALVLQQHVNTHTGEPIEMTLDQIRASEVRDYPISMHPPNDSIGSGSSSGDYNELSVYENSIESDSRRQSVEIMEEEKKSNASASDIDEVAIISEKCPPHDRLQRNMTEMEKKYGESKAVDTNFRHPERTDPVNLSKTTEESTTRMEFIPKFSPMFSANLPPSLSHIPPSHMLGNSFNSMLAANPFNPLGFSGE